MVLVHWRKQYKSNSSSVVFVKAVIVIIAILVLPFSLDVARLPSEEDG